MADKNTGETKMERRRRMDRERKKRRYWSDKGVEMPVPVVNEQVGVVEERVSVVEELENEAVVRRPNNISSEPTIKAESEVEESDVEESEEESEVEEVPKQSFWQIAILSLALPLFTAIFNRLGQTDLAGMLKKDNSIETPVPQLSIEASPELSQNIDSLNLNFE